MTTLTHKLRVTRRALMSNIIPSRNHVFIPHFDIYFDIYISISSYFSLHFQLAVSDFMGLVILIYIY